MLGSEPWSLGSNSEIEPPHKFKLWMMVGSDPRSQGTKSATIPPRHLSKNTRGLRASSSLKNE